MNLDMSLDMVWTAGSRASWTVRHTDVSSQAPKPKSEKPSAKKRKKSFSGLFHRTGEFDFNTMVLGFFWVQNARRSRAAAPGVENSRTMGDGDCRLAP